IVGKETDRLNAEVRFLFDPPRKSPRFFGAADKQGGNAAGFENDSADETGQLAIDEAQKDAGKKEKASEKKPADVTVFCGEGGGEKDKRKAQDLLNRKLDRFDHR